MHLRIEQNESAAVARAERTEAVARRGFSAFPGSRHIAACAVSPFPGPSSLPASSPQDSGPTLAREELLSRASTCICRDPVSRRGRTYRLWADELCTALEWDVGVSCHRSRAIPVTSPQGGGAEGC